MPGRRFIFEFFQMVPLKIIAGDGGLTFKHDGLSFGSNDAAYYIDDYGIETPIMALELTDALNRGSRGNAQYQRFHHALGAVRNGVIGVYYLKPGEHEVQPDLYKMALSAWEIHGTPYILLKTLQRLKHSSSYGVRKRI